MCALWLGTKEIYREALVQMDISSKPVLFRLSSEGRQALKGLVPGKGSFQALVLETDRVGAWVVMHSKVQRQLNQSFPVMLLKWDYVATAAFEFEAERPPSREPIGFQTRR